MISKILLYQSEKGHWMMSERKFAKKTTSLINSDKWKIKF